MPNLPLTRGISVRVRSKWTDTQFSDSENDGDRRANSRSPKQEKSAKYLIGGKGSGSDPISFEAIGGVESFVFESRQKGSRITRSGL